MTVDISTITTDSWPSIREAFFKQIVEAGTPPTDLEHLFKTIAKALGVPKKAVADEFKLFLGQTDASGSENAATRAVQLAREAGAIFWHTPEQDSYASLRVSDHLEHHPTRSRAFRLWLSKIYYDATGKTLYSQALADALAQLESEALFGGDEHPVFTRIGEHGDRVYLDLGRPDWTQVEIGPDGWRLIPSSQSPVRFRRSPHQKPLPVPERSSHGLQQFLALLPLQDRRDIALVLGWLVGSLHPRGPYPIGILLGPKGAGKSTVATLLKSLVDPSTAPLRAEPKDVEALMVACTHAHTVCFDNLSKIAPWFSDALCRVSTGGGLSKRQLYTDADEVVLDVRRPTLLTGIALGVLRDDLADRSLVINLTRIGDEARTTEAEIFEAFEQVHAQALGQLLDAVVLALRDHRSIRARLGALPRMADWACWCEAAAPALGLKPGEIIEAYFNVQAGLEQDLLDADAVARAILALANEMVEGESTEYSTSELLAELERVMGLAEARVKPDAWPRSAAGLGKHLPRITTALRGVGIVVASRRDPKTKNLRWTITTQPTETPPPEPLRLTTPTAPKPNGVSDKPLFAAPQDPSFDPTIFERGDYEDF